MNKSMANHLMEAEATVRMLATHGVRQIFELCGDTTLQFDDVLPGPVKADDGSIPVLALTTCIVSQPLQDSAMPVSERIA